MPLVSKAAFQKKKKKTCQRYVRNPNFKLKNNYKYTRADNKIILISSLKRSSV